MPEEAPPAVVPGETTPPVQPAADPSATAAMARMRIENADLKKRAEDLDAKFKELERKDMDELNRTKAENDDLRKKTAELEPIRDEHGRFVGAIEAACKSEIERMPEEKRAAIEKLTQHVPLTGRLEAIREAAQAIGIAPIVAGTNTNPGGTPAPAPGAPDPAKPMTFQEAEKVSFGKVIASRGVQGLSNESLQAELVALRKQVTDLAAAKT